MLLMHYFRPVQLNVSFFKNCSVPSLITVLNLITKFRRLQPDIPLLENYRAAKTQRREIHHAAYREFSEVDGFNSRDAFVPREICASRSHRNSVARESEGSKFRGEFSSFVGTSVSSENYSRVRYRYAARNGPT